MRPRLLAVALAILSLPAAAQEARPELAPRAYLQSALAALESQHIHRASVDWPALKSEAYALARNAKTPAETYPAIEHVIAALGEKHTVLYPAPPPAPKPAAPAADESRPRAPFRMPEPTGELIEGRVGYLRIPAFAAPSDHPDADLFTAIGRRILLNHDRAGVCGWMLDLRGNTGGNLWPMLEGLLPLLAPRVAAGPYLAFDVDGKVSTVTMAQGRMVGEGVPPGPAYEVRPARHAAAPVAILIDGRTASSGEFVGLAFHGLPGVRYFGETSADYLTVNNPVQLPDGAAIQMTVGYAVRRDGQRQTGPMVPDEATPGEQAREAALHWLPQACTDTPSPGPDR